MTTLSRRHLVTTAAALPALALPALPAIAGTDPIFAAIERVDATSAELNRVSHLDGELPRVDGKFAGTPEHDAWRELYDAAADEWQDAQADALATVPTSTAGALALIKCFIRHEGCFLEVNDVVVFDSLIAFLERAAAQS
jgi:hypothetical protein